jgi:hypothetical protein
VLPLVFGLVWYGIAFSVLNAAVLWIRIRAEDTALTRRPEISRGTRAPTARAHSAHRGCTRSSSPGRADSCRGGIQGLEPIPWTQSSADDIHELRERERRPARSRRRVSVPKLSWSVFLIPVIGFWATASANVGAAAWGRDSWPCGVNGARPRKALSCWPPLGARAIPKYLARWISYGPSQSPGVRRWRAHGSHP